MVCNGLKKPTYNIIYEIRAKFSARSKGHSLFAVALDFYKLDKK
ncbi:hypothetical protein EV197_2168 [Aquimarina brevivitae]|uniref:Uncharacterized protein n=1 Tax=Aquimarina brevivitae TaxID=323412 RepID=A0A4Q7P2L4_9FLAO|nr:hypothetical protein EV197_2168 [Aquimarina brevivitae]